MILAFIGDNGYDKEQAAQEYIAGFVGVHGTVAVDKFIGEDIDVPTLTGAVTTMPFLSPRRMVVVRDYGSNKELAEKFESVAELVADTTDLVIIEGHVDGRSKYLTNLKKIAEVRDFSHLDGDALTDWVITHAQQFGGSLGRLEAQYLIDRVGTNQQLLASELTKLTLFDPTISNESIDELTALTPQSSIFAMLDAAFSGNIQQSLKLYSDQRSQGMEPQAIMGMITWQLLILAIVKAAGVMPAAEIASKAKLSPFVVRKNQTNAKRLSDHKVIEILERAIATDKMLKSIRVNADDAVQSLILSFA